MTDEEYALELQRACATDMFLCDILNTHFEHKSRRENLNSARGTNRTSKLDKTEGENSNSVTSDQKDKRRKFSQVKDIPKFAKKAKMVKKKSSNKEKEVSGVREWIKQEGQEQREYLFQLSQDNEFDPDKIWNSNECSLSIMEDESNDIQEFSCDHLLRDMKIFYERMCDRLTMEVETLREKPKRFLALYLNHYSRIQEYIGHQRESRKDDSLNSLMKMSNFIDYELFFKTYDCPEVKDFIVFSLPTLLHNLELDFSLWEKNKRHISHIK